MKLILDFAFITAFLVNLLIIYLLAKNSTGKLHKQILQIIFVFIALFLCCSYAHLHKIKFLLYATVIFYESIASFIGPLILLYIKSLFLPPKNLIKKNILNFIIPILHLSVSTLLFLFLLYANEEVYLFNYIEIYEKLIQFIIIYSLIYCIISLNVLKKAERLIKHNYSNLEGVDLNWIRHFLIGSIIVISIDISSTLYELWFGELEWDVLHITSIGTSCLVVYLGYHGVLQSKILISPFLLQQENATKLESEEKKTKLSYKYSDTELVELEQRLNKLMENQKTYLDANLSLKSLAELLGISDKKLSTLLNQHMEVSFYDYVNGFRVQNVIDKMKNPSYDKYTLLSIALESGFNSKTSFNRIFKKVTNLSPSEYKKQLR